MRENGEMTEIQPDGMKYSLNHEGLLTIVKAQPSDSGMYQVNISNNQGYAIHSIQLAVVDIPDPPTPPTGKIFFLTTVKYALLLRLCCYIVEFIPK